MNPRLAGINLYDEVEYDGLWEPVLERARWRQLVAHLNPGSKEAPRRKAFALGVLRCNEGHRLRTSIREGGQQTYRCETCWISARRSPIDKIITTLVCSLVDSPTVSSPDQDRAGALSELEAAKGRRDEIDRRWAAGALDDDRYDRLTTAITERITELEVTLARTHGSAVSWFGRGEELNAAWDDLPLADRIAVTESLIEWVELSPAKRQSSTFDPSRLRIRLRA